MFLMLGLSFGLSFWLILGRLIVGLILGLILAQILLLILLLVKWQNEKQEKLLENLISLKQDKLVENIIPVEKISWSWKNAIAMGIGGLILGLILGLIVLIVQPFQLMRQTVGLMELIRQLPMVLITYGLIGCLIGGLSESEIEQKNSINQGVWKSLHLGLIQLLIWGLTFWLYPALIGGLREGLIIGHIFGPMLGMAGGLNGGLGFCLKHFFLRILLYANGFAPWDYARFLISCSDCVLLQQVGGRFRFIHKTVQEHFAAMPFEKH